MIKYWYKHQMKLKTKQCFDIKINVV